VLSAADVLGDGFSPAETARWQLVSATPTSSSGFGKDTADFDGDGNTTEAGFFLVENLFGDGVNRIGFLPSVSAGSAAFKFTLQRDDGLTLVSNMNVTVQSGNVLSGTAGNDILDGGQSDLALQINAAAGDDLIRDGYGNDVLHGGDGNDSLSHNWVDNGNDVYYGDAGNDILDAGWGNDTLVGGSGNDLYVESNLWSGDQTLIDNSTAAAGDVDTLQIGDGSYGTQDYRALWFACDGNDLLVNQLDSSGEIRVHDWFNSARPEAQLDTIRVVQDDGAIYEAHANASFAALIQAMATFSQPGGVGAIDPSLMDEYRAAWTLVTPAAA
jgi:Ca2+-binding RTX toxin-like protein